MGETIVQSSNKNEVRGMKCKWKGKRAASGGVGRGGGEQ
jgi:hypothetical protein